MHPRRAFIALALIIAALLMPALASAHNVSKQDAIFFLYRLKDIMLYVSLFTVGHSLTLLAGVLGGIHANSYIIDAIIGFSVVYKAFDNMGGFQRLFRFQP